MKKLIVCLTLLGILLFPSSAFAVKEFPEKTLLHSNDSLTIKFSQPVDIDSIKNEFIYVENSNKILIPTILQMPPRS